MFLLALLVRVVTAWPITQPGYMDAYYYYHVADSLYHGKGFVEEFVWNWLTIPASLPHPSNVYWMPLISVLDYLSFLILGESFRAAQLPSILLSSLFPVLAYWVGWDIFGRARYAWIMALLAIFSGVGILYWVTPDNFGPFAVVGFLSLVFTYKALRDTPWYHLPAGVMAGLAYLSRPDGVLFLATQLICVCMWLLERRGRRGQAGQSADGDRRVRWSSQITFSLGSVALFALTIAPWLYRNQLAFGAVWPSGGTKTLFLIDYNDIFAYGKELSLEHYLNWGFTNILFSKIAASAENALLVAELMLFYMLPLALIGFWILRRRVEYRPFFVQAALLYVAMSWGFTFPGPRGSFLHSSVALLPFVYGATVVGLDHAIVAAATRLRHWQVPRAQRNFAVLLVAFAVLTSAGLAVRGMLTWNERYDRYEQLAAWLAPRTAPDEPVMLVDPPGYYYSSGRPGIVATNDDLPTSIQVARRYGVRYIVLELAHPWPWHQWYLGNESPPELVLRETMGDMRIYEVGGSE